MTQPSRISVSIIQDQKEEYYGQMPPKCLNFCGRVVEAPAAHRNFCRGDFGAFVGADIIRPVVSPPGKQRRRKAPTMHHRTFYDEIRWYHVGIWCICNIGTPVWPIWFCSKICNGGGRLIAAPTDSVVGGRVPPNHRGKNFVIRAKTPRRCCAGGDRYDYRLYQRISLASRWSGKLPLSV